MDHYSTTFNPVTRYTTPDYIDDSEDYVPSVNRTLEEFVEDELEHYYNLYVFVTQYFTSLALSIVTLAVLGSTGFISFLIFKFKRLRTRTNYIFLNLMISHSLFNIFIFWGCILETFGWYFMRVPGYLYDILDSLCFLTLNLTVLFVLYLAIDWLISTYYSNVLAKYQLRYKYGIIGIYTLASKEVILLVCLVIHIREFPYFTIQLICTALICFVTAITVTVFYIIKKRKPYAPQQAKTDYALIIPCTFFLMWLPVIVIFLSTAIISFLTSVRFSYKTSVILTLISQFFGVFGFASPIVFLRLLAKLDKSFRASYDYVFKKAVRNYRPQDCDEDLENV